MGEEVVSTVLAFFRCYALFRRIVVAGRTPDSISTSRARIRRPHHRVERWASSGRISSASTWSIAAS